ncbi:hypothetical protein H4F45_21075 [Pectobacterium brasiliense]|uniref:Altronate hydrolase n=1 Tax=Pectobacterium brasiliense TaxID=180957 RepID=A0AAE2WIQ2_9GAMM|nr:hypothetical protein [Pectobacterium brasiliense]
MQSFIKIHSLDNVSVAIRDVEQGDTVSVDSHTLTLQQPVVRGHNIAL